MTIIAKTTEGKEYLYSVKSAHKVSRANADYICKICNEYKYRLKDGEKWNVYEIDAYDSAHEVALMQHGRVYKGIVKMYSSVM